MSEFGKKLEEMSLEFAVRSMRLGDYLRNTQHEYIVSKQVVRSATSIGANIAEAQQAQSRADFLSKMSIALKEGAETEYWLKVLKQAELLTQAQYNSINADLSQLLAILVSVVKHTKVSDSKVN